MNADLYPRPNRAEIAARLGALTPKQPERDPLEWFAVHVRAALKACGWSNVQLAEHAGCDPITIGKAVNKTGGISLGSAANIARALGKPLPDMLSPYTCGTCHAAPPAGFRCLECDTEGRRPS